MYIIEQKVRFVMVKGTDILTSEVSSTSPYDLCTAIRIKHLIKNEMHVLAPEMHAPGLLC